MASTAIYRHRGDPYASTTQTVTADSSRRGYVEAAPRQQPPIVASRAIPAVNGHRSPINSAYRGNYASNAVAGPSSSGSYRIEIDRAHPEREVIVIGDSPSPPPPNGIVKRDLEAQAGPSKKRKADDGTSIHGYNSDLPYAQPAPAYPNGSSLGQKRKLGDEVRASISASSHAHSTRRLV